MVGLLIDNDVVVGCSSEEEVYGVVDYGGAWRGVEETGNVVAAAEEEIFGYGREVNSDL